MAQGMMHNHPTLTLISTVASCVFPRSLSLIYFVSQSGFSSSTIQLPLFNSKLQVLANTKSFDHRFHNTDRYSTLVDKLSGSCGVHKSQTCIAEHKEMFSSKYILIWREGTLFFKVVAVVCRMPSLYQPVTRENNTRITMSDKMYSRKALNKSSWALRQG